MAREPKTAKTVYKLRMRDGTRSTLFQLMQLFGILGVLLALIGAMAACQVYFCREDAPGSTLQECFSGKARAKAKKASP